MMTREEMMAALDGSLSGAGSSEAEHASYLLTRKGIRDVYARLEAAEKCIAAATDNTKTLTDFDAARSAWEATK